MRRRAGGMEEGGAQRNIGTARWRRQDHLMAKFTVRFSAQESGPKSPCHEREDEEGKKKKEGNWKKQLRV